MTTSCENYMNINGICVQNAKILIIKDVEFIVTRFALKL
jgi:hypothetical protein